MMCDQEQNTNWLSSAFWSPLLILIVRINLMKRDQISILVRASMCYFIMCISMWWLGSYFKGNKGMFLLIYF